MSQIILIDDPTNEPTAEEKQAAEHWYNLTIPIRKKSNNNWRTIRQARQDQNQKSHWAYGLAWVAIGAIISWALVRGF